MKFAHGSLLIDSTGCGACSATSEVKVPGKAFFCGLLVMQAFDERFSIQLKFTLGFLLPQVFVAH